MKQTDCKDVFDQSIMVDAHFSMIYWKWIILSLFAIKLYKHYQWRLKVHTKTSPDKNLI